MYTNTFLLSCVRSLLPVVLPQSVAISGSDVLALPLTLHLAPSEEVQPVNNNANHALLQKQRKVLLTTLLSFILLW